MRIDRAPAFIVVLCFLALLSALPARAGSAWSDIAPTLFGDRTIEDGRHVIDFSAPYRAMDQRAVPIAIDAGFADGRSVTSITLVIDENPMPVAAIFRFPARRERVSLGTNVRLDQPSAARVIVEASDGRLYMTEAFIKASGLGVCAAPPTGDQELAVRHMGEMRLTELTPRDGRATQFRRRVQLDIRHPQNTGLQMNQITMIYLPLRFVRTVEVRQGEERLFDVEAGMSLSENPRIVFEYQRSGAPHLSVRVRDTSDSGWQREFAIDSNS
jgi:sulfur-oxidizing protein SoxY